MNYKCRDNQACILQNSFLTLQGLNSGFSLSVCSCLLAKDSSSLNYRKLSFSITWSAKNFLAFLCEWTLPTNSDW